MKAKRPKRWNLSSSCKLMKISKQSFRVVISKYKSKIYDSSNNSINFKTACITKSLNLQI